MGKTDKTVWVCGDDVPVYRCDQCGDDSGGSCLYWKEKDFALCANCIESGYSAMFKPSSTVASRRREKAQIPSKLKKAVFERDAYRCRYCGSHTDLTADHVIPESRGGPTTVENLVTACALCNLRKGARIPEEAGMKLRAITD